MILKRKIMTVKLKPGMILANGVFSESGNLLVEAHTILNDKMISMLRANSVFIVYIEEGELDKQHNETGNQESADSQSVVKDSPDFQQFQKIYSKTLDLYTNSLNQIIYQNKTIDMNELLNDIDGIIDQEISNFELMSMLNHMKDSDDVTYVHSVNVALIGNVIGKWLKLSPADLELLTVAGLLHDMGKTQISQEIMNKPGPLTSNERLEVQKHPIFGYQIVKNQPIDQKIKNVILTHHERGDGSGYPLKSTFNDISRFSRIIAVADVFDAMTSNRCYRNAINPFDVIHMFQVDGHMQFDSEVVIVFLNNILETYIHSQVILNDGRIGEILFLNKREPSRPIVKVNDVCVDLTMKRELFIVNVV